MSLSGLFIRRPVLTIVVWLLVLLLGGLGGSQLAVRQYPQVEETTVTVKTNYPGASADLVQSFISAPIAQAVSSTENIDYVSSSSIKGRSTISVHMRLGSNPDVALSEVVSKVQEARRKLPQDAEEPVILKGTGRSFSLVFLGFRSDRMSSSQLAEYVVRVAQPSVATIPGVSEVQVFGANSFSMRLWLDPVLLASRNLTPSEVVSAVRNNNFLSAPGQTENELTVFSVNAETNLSTAEEFGAIPLKGSGDNVVRLSDVARVEFTGKTMAPETWFDEHRAVNVGVQTTPSANALDVAKAVRAIVPKLQAAAPEGLHVKMTMDMSLVMEESIREVYKTIGLAVAIVVLVILVFLGSLRTVAIPVVTIPLSLIGSCFVIYTLGYSINLLTLLAMVLAIGLVVDDAIVVVENIHRHVEMGKSPFQAAIDGMKEITAPVLAMTVTLATVYAPIGFTQGLTGNLFREFAFTLAGAVVLSGLAALTISAMMSAYILRPTRHDKEAGPFERFEAWVDDSFGRLSEAYGRALTATLKARLSVVALAGILVATMTFLFLSSRAELAPEEDQGFLFMYLTAPQYASINYMASYTHEVKSIVGAIPEVETSFLGIGIWAPNLSNASYSFVPWRERDRTTKEIMRQMQAAGNKLAGVEAVAFTPNLLPGASGMPVQYVVRTLESPARAYEVGEEIRRQAVASGKVLIAQNSLSYDMPEMHISIDRARAAALGVSAAEVGATLNILMGENWISRFDVENRAYEVIPQAITASRNNPDILGQYYVRSLSGAMVPLSAITSTSVVAAPSSIEQFNQLNSVTLSAIPAQGVTSADALQEFRDIGARTLPEGFNEDFSGESRLILQEGSSLAFAFIFALVAIYLVLAAQFESFRDPLVIMTAVPLSIFGALIPLTLGFTTLNIYTEIGMITLVGLITKHGILIVQFANNQRALGKPIFEAIEEAARVRFRPILMTTAAMVLGAVPLVMASGAGAGARSALGLVIAFGMAIGTAFTLFVVPVFYTYLTRPDRSDAKSGEEPQRRILGVVSGRQG